MIQIDLKIDRFQQFLMDFDIFVVVLDLLIDILITICTKMSKFNQK